MAAATTNAQYMKDRARRQGMFLSLPAVFWLGIFFILPVLIVLAISFMTPTTDGAGGQFPLTLNHYGDALDFFNKRLDISVMARPALTALVATFVSAIIAYQLAYFAVQLPTKRERQRILVLISLPFIVFILGTFGSTVFGQDKTIPILFSPDQPISDFSASIQTFVQNVFIRLQAAFIPVGQFLYWLKTSSTLILVIPTLAIIFLALTVLPIYFSVRKLAVPVANETSPRSRNFRLVLPSIIYGFIPTLILMFLVFAIPDFLNPRPIYSAVILRSVWISFITTLICLVMGYPLSFFIATRKSQSVRQFAMFLIIMPFWTNFLVRTYALKTIIAPDGTLAGILNLVGGLGILQNGKLTWLNTSEAVILGLVYSYLPFMVLPIYAVVEKFDFRFVEAANDLGANDWKTLIRVVIPMTAPGLVAGFILVFIPTIGAFVTPDLLGGVKGVMISNLIQQNIRGSGANYPRGSALSAVLMLLVTIGVIIYLRYGDREVA
jgi:spermidine/putrescine transport system permease protein